MLFRALRGHVVSALAHAPISIDELSDPNFRLRMLAIVKGERAVTADTALRLARFFGTSPEFWMNLQAMHDLTKARM